MLAAFKEWRATYSDKSLTALATSLYYSMAEERQQRGDAPDAEAEVHAPHEHISRDELDVLFGRRRSRWRPSMRSRRRVQRVGSNHGYALLFGSPLSEVGRPTLRLCPARRGGARDGDGRRFARGNGAGGRARGARDDDLADAIVDARAEGVPFEARRRRRPRALLRHHPRLLLYRPCHRGRHISAPGEVGTPWHP